MSDFRTWDELTLAEQLQSEWSDYHKAVCGFRPRFATAEQLNSVEWLQGQMKELAASLRRREVTREGRNSMRDDGWVIESPTAEEDGWTDPYAVENDPFVQVAFQQEEPLGYAGEKYEQYEVTS